MLLILEDANTWIQAASATARVGCCLGCLVLCRQSCAV